MGDVIEREALLDDSRRFVARATAAGVHVRYIEHPEVVHMWMVMAPELPESCQAFDAAARFLNELNKSMTTARAAPE